VRRRFGCRMTAPEPRSIFSTLSRKPRDPHAIQTPTNYPSIHAPGYKYGGTPLNNLGISRMNTRFALALALCWTIATSVPAADWPMWRHDSSRSAASSQELAAVLHPQWTLNLPALEPAWPDQEMMWFDRCYEPIVVGGLMFVGSSRTDDLSAYDIRTGRKQWTFLADGPIRLAPAAWREQVYIASDDGYLYCLAAADGKLLWKFRGGPRDRKVLGNGRMVSTWPARGGPVIADDTVTLAPAFGPSWASFCTRSTPRRERCAGLTTATARCTSSSRTTPILLQVSHRKDRW
jgi:hypothetical protein